MDKCIIFEDNIITLNKDGIGYNILAMLCHIMLCLAYVVLNDTNIVRTLWYQYTCVQERDVYTLVESIPNIFLIR